MSKAEADRHFKAIRSQPGNDRCAECRARDVSWVVLDHGVLVCVQCAGAHRGLGTHISKVRSSQHDRFTLSEFEWLESLGNAKNAALYEGALPATVRRPAPAESQVSCPDVVRRTWLRLKYDEQRFTAGTVHFAEALSHQQQRGWLLKQGSFIPSWKQRFFAIRGRGTVLSYHKDESMSERSIRGAMRLADCTIAMDPEEPLTLKLKRGAVAVMSHDGGGGGGRGSGSSSSSSLSLKALTIQDAEGWAWALYQCGGPGSAQAKVSPEEAAEAQAAVIVAARRRKAAMPTFFGRGGRQQQP